MRTFIKHYRNARIAIEQINNGEWVPRHNSISDECLTAHRGDLELWIGNGAWFCEISGRRCFGLIWRHLVWWGAARRMKAKADAKMVMDLSR